jgi:hypothetical protein
MDKTLIWEAFAALSPEEMRSFGKWVRSPFFNRKEHLVALNDYLQHCVQTGRLPESEAAYLSCYPGGPYKDVRMRLANSDLLALLEKYWIYLENQDNAAHNRIALMRAYRKRGLSKHQGIALREARKAIEGEPWRHAEYYGLAYELELEVFHAASAAKRYEAFNLQTISDLVDTVFITGKLRHICLSLSHQAVFKATYRFGLQAAIEAYVEQENLLQIPAISLYLYACRFLSDPNAESYFFLFRETLTAHADQFPPEELRTLYLLAINFGVKKINESESSWRRATLELYQQALGRELLMENGVLSRFAYNNIVTLAVHLGDIDWAEHFIHQYKPFLERQYREASYSLNLARVAYVRKDYRTALLHLQRADYKDFINSANAKVLQLKIYCESGETDLLESHLDSMTNYIRRHGSAGYHRDNYRNIVRHTRALLRCNPLEVAGISRLKKQIEAEPILTERQWLLEQVEQYLPV